jgi:hypothetical protein
MRFIRDSFEIVCSCVLVGSLYGFPLIAMGIAGLFNGEPEVTLEAAPDRTITFDTSRFALQGEALASLEAAAPTEETEAAQPVETSQLLAVQSDSAKNAAPVEIEGHRARKLEASVTEALIADDGADASTTDKGKKCLPENEGIAQVDGTTWSVDAEIVEYYVKHLNQAEKLAAVSWNHDAEGKVDGFKVRRMRCGNVLRQAGLQNGDVIQAINGTEVHSIPTAISAYTKLRSKKVLKLTVARGGELVHIKYKLES